MRQLVTILPLFGLLVTNVAGASDDPFDFSSPLPRTSSERRASHYFSRNGDSGESTSKEHPLRAARSGPALPETPAARPASRADDQAAAQERTPSSSRPPTVSFSREIARDRKPATNRSPQETLRRFDEFLKTRNVISADHTVRADEQESSSIRQVQGTKSDSPFDDLPSLGDLDEMPPQRPQAPAPRQRPVMEMRPAADGQPQVHTLPRRGRLTDPISTDSAPTQTSAIEPTPTPTPTPTPVAAKPEPFRSQATTPGTGRAQKSPDVARYRSPAQSDKDPAEESSAAAVQTSWSLLSPLNLGQECTAELTVRNTGADAAERVSLEVRVPASVRVLQTVPEPIERQAFLGWKFDELTAGEATTIQITFVASDAGPLDLSAHVRHTSSQRESFTVAQPLLEVALSGPKEVRVGEPASQTVLVKNPGTGIAANVKLQAMIPAGLEHAEGEHLLMAIGSLNPGEVRSVRLAMVAVGGGDHVLQVQADADSGLVKTAAAEVTVIAPSLKAGIDGPSLRYLGREAEYRIRVLNDGMAATNFVQVAHRVPEGFDFVSAERGVKFDPATRLVNWYVGALESEESQDLKIRLVAHKLGEFVHDVRATSEHGTQANAQLATRIEGAASLVVKVADLEDPVEVGSETAYEITITNEGTAPARLVGLTCEIPSGLSLVDVTGPSDHRVQEEMIGFRPIDALPAGESLTYQVHVKGGAAGDQRFRCRLTSESLSQPLFSEELTKFYSE